jgi:hypothetical protein
MIQRGLHDAQSVGRVDLVGFAIMFNKRKFCHRKPQAEFGVFTGAVTIIPAN